MRFQISDCRFQIGLQIGLAFVLALAVVQSQPAVEPSSYSPALFKALRWRSIGPYRGGRVTAVAGGPGQPLVYYMGATGGGGGGDGPRGGGGETGPPRLRAKPARSTSSSTR